MKVKRVRYGGKYKLRGGLSEDEKGKVLTLFSYYLSTIVK